MRDFLVRTGRVFHRSEVLGSVRVFCEVFQMTEVLGSVNDFPRSEVLGSVQDFRWFEVLRSARDFPRVTKSCTLPFLPGRKRCPVASLAGKHAMPCSAFAGQETWYARAHGFEGPRDSRLSEVRSFKFLRYRAPASREFRTREHRNEVTGQSPRHGASIMTQTVCTDARGFGATPPRSASMFIFISRLVVYCFTSSRFGSCVSFPTRKN